MTTKRITTGWRGLSIARETALGSPATVDTAFNFEGPPVDIEINEAQTDENEVTGYNEPGVHEVLNWKLDGSHTQRATPHNLAYFLAAVMGKVTTQTPDAINNPSVRRHWLERDLVNVSLPTVTLVEFDGIAQKRFAGVFVKSVKLSGERNDFLKLEAQMGGMGKEESSAIAKPAGVAESYLRYGDVELTRGGSLSGSVASGDLVVSGSPVSFKADLKRFFWTIDNQALPVYEMGDNTGFVSRAERGDRFTHDLSAVFEMQDDSHKTGLVNGTQYVLNIPIVGGVIPGGSGAFNYSANLIFPKVVYREAKKGRNGQALIVNAEFQVLEDSTYGSAIVKIVNEQSGYLT
jgi:Phage tail tube protein